MNPFEVQILEKAKLLLNIAKTLEEKENILSFVAASCGKSEAKKLVDFNKDNN